MAFSADTFVERFALPLVRGGEIHVGRPVDGEDLRRLEVEISGVSGASELAEACARRASYFWPDAVSTALDGKAARLLAGAHNTLFLSHPEREGLFRASRGTSEVVAFTSTCLEVGPPAKDTVAVARHALLGRVPLLRREDVSVRFWAGRREFFGQTPPGRLVAWPRVRRVEREQRTVRWLETEMLPEQRALLAKLLAVSPVTDLLSIDQGGRPQPDFVLLAPVLGRPRIARLIAYEYASRGVSKVEAALCLGFWRLVCEAFPGASELALGGKDLPPRRANELLRQAMRAVVGLVQYLVAVEALVGEVQLPPRKPPQLGFGAVLAAAQRVGLLATGEALGHDEVRGRFEAALKGAEQHLGAERLTPMVEALQGALTATRAAEELAAG